MPSGDNGAVPSHRQPVRFGVFEVNLDTGDLRRNGSKVKLQEQPFQVLAALLEKPGEIVTKEDLQERIWKDDTFVDFDRSLATAINKVRQALGDSATRPRFVETVAKRGYRFIGLAGQASTLPADNIEALPPGAVVVQRSSQRALQALAAVLGIALLGVSYVYFNAPVPEPAEQPVRRFSFPVEGITFRSGGSISPDGKYILYATGTDGGSSLWLRSLENESARELPGTAGVRSGFWSPDSLSIGFGTARELKTVSLDGAPQTLCELPSLDSYPFLGGTWSPDGGRIIFSSGLLLYEIAARGGQPKLLFDPGDVPRRYFEDPHFLASESQTQAVVFTAAVNSTDRMLTVMNLETGQQQELVPGAWPVYSLDGHLIYGPADRAYSGLQALPFSLDTLTPSGQAFPITETGWEVGVSRDGTLAYLDRAGATTGTLVWRNRAGELLETVSQPQTRMFSPALSPDGQSVAVTALENGNRDIWIHDLTRSTKDRLTFDSRTEGGPTWSPSGREVAYRQVDGPLRRLMTKAADGTVDATALVEVDAQMGDPDWSRDGRYLVYPQTGGRATRWDIHYLELGTGGGVPEPVAVLGTPANELDPKFSPNGRFVAYVSDVSGRNEIYVHSFPDGSAGRWHVSTNGGTQPRWRSDGQELYYVENSALMAVAVSTDREFTLGQPQMLFESADLVGGSGATLYDVSAAGQRFVTIAPVQDGGEATPPTIRIVENWYEEFRQQDK